VALVLLALMSWGLAQGTSSVSGSPQDGEFCNRLKIAGTGSFEVGVSVNDKTQALEYYNFMQGDGDLEMDSSTVDSGKAAKIPGSTGNASDQPVPLNLLEDSKISYSGKTPLVGFKYIHSNDFWGGIGAEITESFAVTQLDRESTTFFASADPASTIKDPKKIAEMLGTSPVDTVGINSKSAFNGTWTTDSRMHKFMEKDVKAHESFTGQFEVEKLIKFHENPVPEQKQMGCEDIDC
jgi:hypothetical protein